jgi:hypothetical protein
MEATKTAPGNWQQKIQEWAAIEANMLRIPLTRGNVFTF